jgi:3-dehydroquinate synthetase
MRSDKKARGGRLRFVLPRRIGRVEWGVELSEQLLEATWKELRAESSTKISGARRVSRSLRR